MDEQNTSESRGNPPRQLRTWLARWRMRIAANAALTVAIMSMVVSVCAFGFTVYSAKLDLRYKELSIRPLVTFNSHAGDFSFSLKNVGLGPALVTHLVFRLGGKCYDVSSDVMSGDELKEVGHKLKSHFIGVFERVSAQWSAIEKATGSGHIEIALAGPNTIIPANGSLRIFGFSQAFATLVHERITALGWGARDEINAAFVNATNELPFGFRFCSLTGLSCLRKTLKACPFGKYTPLPYE